MHRGPREPAPITRSRTGRALAVAAPAMSRLLHDRFVSLGSEDAWDLATGARVRLRHLSVRDPEAAADERPGVCIDWGATPEGGYFEAWERARAARQQPSPQDTELLLEALDQGADGEPRLVRIRATSEACAASLARMAAREARRRGYVTIAASLYDKVTASMADELRHRTLALIDTDGTANGVLARAAVLNPRPHVLISIQGGYTQTGNRKAWSIVREARAVYGAADAARHVSRAEAACAAAREGRHAQADRGLREAAAALRRREIWDSAAEVQIMLGRLLLERGQATAADDSFSEAVDHADRGAVSTLGYTARVWLAAARIESDKQTLAESLLRATCATAPPAGGWARAWSDSVLARCLIGQGRIAEARDAVSEFALAPFDGVLDPQTAAGAVLVTIDTLVRGGQLFEAGQRCGELRVLVDSCGDERARVCVAVAALQVAAAAGDEAVAATHLAEVLRLARRCHLPLAALEGRLLWAQMLCRAGRADRAQREQRRLLRLSRAAPAFLRRRIGSALTVAAPPLAQLQSDTAVHDTALALLRLTDEESDEVALGKLVARLLSDLRAARVDLQAGDARPAPLVTSGAGIMARTGVRALEAGIVIGPEDVAGAQECAAPIRTGNRTIASLACRWPVGRSAPNMSRGVLEMAAAIAAPRVTALLQHREDASKVALEIPELVGCGAAMQELRKAIASAARAPFAVLVEGESGSGKELVARAIHHLSPRRDHRFCDINCAALPDELLESELFGHARGAFTGALLERRGLFEEAHGGTLFLDELPDLSLRAQAKLLRVLQDGEVRRVGESFTRHVDVRIIAATNRSMAEAVAAGQFRRDLLYRLDVIRIRIPPLRERPGDIPLLARHFWKDAAARAGTRAALSQGAVAALARYHWPGNVRELQNAIAALAVAAPSRGAVSATLLPAAITGSTVIGGGPLADARLQFERRFVEIALARAGGSRTRAAAELGLSRQGLMKLLARLKLAS
jgi:DNA-binding NtrC family response regulator